MRITADNYEQWALDYLEGTLPATQREAFERFLDSDNGAQRQLRSLQQYMPVAQSGPVAFPDPGSLLHGTRITPLRRALSLVSGAAAAAAVAGVFMFLGRTDTAAPQAHHHSGQADTVPTAEIVVAQNRTDSPEAAKPLQTARSARSESLAMQSAEAGSTFERVTAPAKVSGHSRLSDWNRKTAALLERMQARGARQAEPQKQPDEAAAASLSAQEGLLASVSVSERKGAFMTERARQHSQAQTTSGALSLLPPDAQTPILSAPAQTSFPGEEGVRTGEYLQSEETRRHREGGLLRALLNPIEKISPIKYYQTEQGSGVEIASIIRIGSRNN